MDRVDFAKCMAVLESAVGREMPRDMVGVWFEVLQHLSYDDLKRGILGAVSVYKFAGFPPVALVLEHATGGNLTTQDRSVAAWDCVRDSISRVGGYVSVSFDDPVINATIRALGGWVALTEKTTEELVWVRKEFLETYRALNASGVPLERAKPLTGLIDQTNSREGWTEGVGALLVESGLPQHRIGVVRDEKPAKRLNLPAPLPVASKAAKALALPAEEPEEKRQVTEDELAAERQRQLEALENRKRLHTKGS